MLYYNKGTVYIRLEDQSKEVLEVFSSPTHYRIMRTYGEAMYDQTLQRITQFGFTQITDQEFIPVYINVKNEL
jgi:hypothetical protein